MKKRRQKKGRAQKKMLHSHKTSIKTSKPLIIAAIAVAAVLALSLLFIFSDAFVGEAIKRWAVQPGGPLAQCSDGIDNDKDGLIDYPIEPGCAGASDNSEDDDMKRADAFAHVWWDYLTPEGYPLKLSNLVEMVPLENNNLFFDPSLPQEIKSLPQKTKELTDKQPEGHRAIQIWGVDERRLSFHPGDVVLDPNGKVVGFTDSFENFQPYAGIFWEHAVEDISSDITKFFTEYKKLTGKLTGLFRIMKDIFKVPANFGRLLIVII